VRSKELLARLEAGMRVLELEDRLCQLASVDSLTGMLNLRTAMQFLEKEWGRAIRYSHPLSCVMWDVDHFKPINDTHGHFVGDESLRSLSRLAESSCRRSDYMCRWGGDEFFVIMPETNEEGASCWAERLCSAIAGTGFSFRGQAMSITASFGVAERQEFMQSPKQMLDLVDHAMYEAKKAGRNRVVTARSICLSSPHGTASVATELVPGAIPYVFASAGTESAGYSLSAEPYTHSAAKSLGASDGRNRCRS
jgi:diguanylate cyclase (GGDEF)-like protein